LVTSFSRILIFWAPISPIGDLFFTNPDFQGINELWLNFFIPKRKTAGPSPLPLTYL